MDLLSVNQGMFYWSVLVFILLVIILGKFAWKPMLKMIEDRESDIDKSIQDAETAKIEAEALLNQHKQLMAESEQRASDLIKKAKAVADKQISDAKADAQLEARKMLDRAEAEIISEKESALKSLREEVASLVVQAAGHLISQNLDDKSNKTLVDNYINTLPKN